MLIRTPLIATICALLALGHSHAVAAEASPTRLLYDILDGDKRVGQLEVSLQPSPQGLIARQHGQLELRRMMLTAKLEQTVEERWQGQSLLALSSETRSDVAVGESKKSLAVRRETSGELRATVDGKSHDLPPDALPLSIWSGRTLTEGPHFNLTTGELIELKTNASANAKSDPPQIVRYEGEECRHQRFESVNGSKRSTVAAWLGRDDIVCRLSIAFGRDLLTYVRRPAPSASAP